ncbi:hypothetical protein [Candidatus Nitrosocosmicus arcticus]|uniref:Uncharacterized protein n=1 Tax=Candidatus Nitrosocosmicus arcticus TaxID=2035267 RepID=A0A557SXW7_9ARCH|nr:hypothetical protein [Candidatus Nitrosocosmicus arcticus]TVP41433.1 hypothetical protein NARC_30147 [Candidatus Nitrosocosmicus arcticus]
MMKHPRIINSRSKREWIRLFKRASIEKKEEMKYTNNTEKDEYLLILYCIKNLVNSGNKNKKVVILSKV